MCNVFINIQWTGTTCYTARHTLSRTLHWQIWYAHCYNAMCAHVNQLVLWNNLWKDRGHILHWSHTCTIHSTIHCHSQSAWPSPYSCVGSLLQRSHTALALGPCGLWELQTELQCCHTVKGAVRERYVHQMCAVWYGWFHDSTQWCFQKWSVSPLHITWGRHNGTWWDWGNY